MGATRVLGPAAHCALSIPRMTSEAFAPTDTSAEVLCEMVRLALLLLVAKIKGAFSLIAGEMVPLQRKFEDMLPLVPDAFGLCPELVIWCVIAVTCSHKRETRHSLTSAIRYAMARMSMSTAAEAIEVAKTIIWVEKTMAAESEDLILDIQSAPRVDDT